MAEHPTDAVLRRYDTAQREFERAGGYAWRTRLEAVARGLGFSPADLDRPLRHVLGRRADAGVAVRALAAEPDVLLLDEPTNHLDTDAIEWLEAHLAGLDAGVVFVSHDRWFLESVATGVLEIDRGRGRYEKGSLLQLAPGEGRAGRRAGRRVRAPAGGACPPSAVRRPVPVRHEGPPGAEQAEGDGRGSSASNVRREQRSLKFDFPPPVRSGRIVVEAEKLIVEVAGRTLIADGGFAVERGQRVALIGPNGAGKTTLLETLLGRREAAAGRVKLGHNVTVGYYSQQSLELPEGLRVIDAVVSGTKLTGPQARTLLGRFLFSGEEVEKPVSALSGGERRRLSLLRTVVSGANFLVLDEPTNHLDIESREALEDALLGFPGTLLFVSHDRALIEALATRTLAIEGGRLNGREGGFGDYATGARVARRPRSSRSRSRPSRSSAKEPRPSQRAARQTAKLERAIATPGGGAGRPRDAALTARGVRRRRRGRRGRHPPPGAPEGARVSLSGMGAKRRRGGLSARPTPDARSRRSRPARRRLGARNGGPRIPAAPRSRHRPASPAGRRGLTSSRGTRRRRG